MLSILLALCMALSLMPVTALAGDITSWAQLQAAFSAGGSVILKQDVTAGADDSALIVPSGKEVTLDLNGYAIDRALASSEAKTNGNVITNHGTFSMSGGTVQNNTAAMNGGGVWSDGALFSIEKSENGIDSPQKITFDAEKWRSGTGAVFFMGCAAERGNGVKWKPYKPGTFAIS